MTFVVRRVRVDEWQQVRALRLQALHDPAASIAFLDSVENASRQPDEFWQQRTSNAAVGDDAAQFIAIDADGEWFGTVTVLHPLGVETGLVVGVYVADGYRGSGTIDALLTAAVDWTTARQATALTLEVHVDNARARAAYLRNGFALTGETTTADIGEEYVMLRELTPGARRVTS
ncbi:GNAT family N-acetyltransferase [Microbacterium sp. H1-D42]|uniref:GNAT family N-acetyltransferase n=1 Tax=Microbacterium sp. H1-D42 TaxID=2925844 RepID=UPI001F52E6AF|nr:GNAT family N-acetyltransferase [Microbacterium sp. H1-D42]UNK72458.1 GNAT family N-acetyltransferase [Microbacterium sp. H1-D42]